MWRPKNWDNPYKLSDKAKEKGYALIPGDGWHYGYEAGADAILEALKKEGKYIDASEYPYGFVLNEIPPIQRLTRMFKGWVVIIPDERIKEG